MRCEELMSTSVVVVAPDDTLQKAARMMRERGIGFLPVCGAEGRTVGAITDRDIVIRALAEGDGERRVEEVMTRGVTSCPPEADVDEAEALMAQRQKSRLMICDEDGRVMGIVSLSDLAQREGSNQAGATLRRVTWRRHDRLVEGGGATRVADVMKREVACVGPDDSIGRAAEVMRDLGVGFLPVCGEERKVIGVITDRDLAVRAVAERRERSTAVRDVMHRDVVGCAAQDDLARAGELMAERQKSRLVVCDDGGRLEGVLSLSDLAKHEPAAASTRTLQSVSAREAS